MGRTFTAASSMYAERTSAVVTSTPITMACWINPTTNPTPAAMMAVYQDGLDTVYATLDASSGVVRGLSRNTGAATVASSTGTLSTGGWQHAAAVFDGTNTIAYRDGGNSGSVAGGAVPAAVNRTAIGRRTALAPFYQNGSLAVPCIWNVALNADEIAMLAAGFHPSLVRPESIVALWESDQGYSPEPDHWGGFDLTLTNSPAYVADPPLIYPQGIVQAVYGAGGAPPAAGNRRRRFIICGAAA